MHTAIPTFIINLKEREDRNAHTRQEFSNRDEFELTIVEAIKNERGALGLIFTIQLILKTLVPEDAPYIIIGEDDHLFTKDYSRPAFLAIIEEAGKRDADLLLGGISALRGCIPVTSNLMWVDEFTGTQFVIIFRNFFSKIIQADIKERNVADRLFSKLSNNKYFIYPFISVQQEFGYSDVTNYNNETGRVTSLFENTSKTVQLLNKMYSFYQHTLPNQPIDEADFEDMVLPTYIINLPEREDRRKHILNQFEGKKEFDCQLINAVKHTVGAYGLWQTIRHIIEMAIENEDEVIIICHDDHEFSADYSSAFLFKNILEAHLQGADYLSGGSGGFNFALPITENRYWVNPCLCTQFIVVYRKFFNRILAEPFNADVIVDRLLGDMTSHKMLLFPFISYQRDFGYSDVTAHFNESKGLITEIFKHCEQTLGLHQEVYKKLSLK